jgi:hypothetical protein
LALRRESGIDNLLIYDFHTPDTIACVVLEFIDAYGAGLASLARGRIAVKANVEQNARALRILKVLVGKHDLADFHVDETLNLNTYAEKALLFRHWHSMLSDEQICTRANDFLLDGEFPIKGTLGGWYLGMLAKPPHADDGVAGIKWLISSEMQQQRFAHGGGLPTRQELYHPGDSSSGQIESQTGAQLGQIRRYVEHRLIKRSVFPDYSRLKLSLWALHNKVMAEEDEAKLGVIVREWSKAVSSGK